MFHWLHAVLALLNERLEAGRDAKGQHVANVMAFQPGVDSQAVMTQVMEQSEVAFILLVLVGLLLAPNLFFVGFLWTILNPRRGPQDLIAGTQLVPR